MQESRSNNHATHLSARQGVICDKIEQKPAQTVSMMAHYEPWEYQACIA